MANSRLDIGINIRLRTDELLNSDLLLLPSLVMSRFQAFVIYE